MASKTVVCPTGHGRHIFLYSNLRTNQVLYSLKRGMDSNAMISQLPYAGKKTVPPKLRKDLWHPFATVTFPIPAQGLAAYRKLREFRQLHELNWDKTKAFPMLPPETQQKLKQGRIVPSRRDRRKIIMDQKANTVADLAAVLQIQSNEGDAMQRDLQGRRYRRTYLLQSIDQLTRTIRQAVDPGPQSREHGEGESAESRDRAKDVNRLSRERQHLGNAFKSVQFQIAMLLRTPKPDMNELTKAVHQVREDADDAQRSLHSATAAHDQHAQLSEGGMEELKKLAKTLAKDRASLERKIVCSVTGSPPHRAALVKGKLIQAIIRNRRFTAKGVGIRWTDRQDANYAARWPKGVVHRTLKRTRHVAPDPEKRTTAPLKSRKTLIAKR